MRDSDYIPAKQRDYIMRFDVNSTNYVTPGQYEALDDSHDIADSVMRELAEALRKLMPPPVPDGVAGIHFPAGEDALSRFDALGGNDE